MSQPIPQPMTMTIARESWPIAGSFTISRGSKTAADVVVVTLKSGPHEGRGEAVPYGRYQETVEGVMADLATAQAAIETGLTPSRVPELLKYYAARNALDCALWDLQAKMTGVPCWQTAHLKEPQPQLTAFTISLDTPEKMAAAALSANRPLLKLKLGREGDAQRLTLIRQAVPQARLIIDANEGWQPENLSALLQVCADVGVELVEQPLRADHDDLLSRIPHPVPICADESVHDLASLPSLKGKYDAINIKLDKAGGLTPALTLARTAQAQGFTIMVGCMLATSLAMAPALLLGQFAQIIDLDGPLLLKHDRSPGLVYRDSYIMPASLDLWG